MKCKHQPTKVTRDVIGFLIPVEHQHYICLKCGKYLKNYNP